MGRASFTFRLERVRALREHAEGLRKEELAASIAVRSRGEATLRAVTERLGDAAHAERDALEAGGAVQAHDLLFRQGYREQVEVTRRAAALELDRCDAEVQARRGALMTASVDRQALERLKERRRVDYVREQSRIEHVVLDEMGLAVHRRREEIA